MARNHFSPHPRTPDPKLSSMHDTLQFVRAPSDWYYHRFPLPHANNEVITLDWVVAVAEELLERAARTGDEAHSGPVLHWAHLLKVAQDAGGDWPGAVNARTGAAVGTTRTRSPARLLQHLGEAMDSSEFDEAVARCRRSLPAPLT